MVTDKEYIVFYKDDAEAKTKLVHDIKNCCLYNGFFQITGHNVPRNLQNKVFECSKQFFTMPLEEKNKISKSKPLQSRTKSQLTGPKQKTPGIEVTSLWALKSSKPEPARS